MGTIAISSAVRIGRSLAESSPQVQANWQGSDCYFRKHSEFRYDFDGYPVTDTPEWWFFWLERMCSCLHFKER